MLTNLISKCGAVLAAAIVTMTPSMVSAKEIALTFSDHDLTISGEFVAFEDDSFVLMTNMGEITVPAMLVTCEGADCYKSTLVQASGS